jgi:hypothetical protein
MNRYTQDAEETKPWTRQELRRMYPQMTEEMSDDELDSFIEMLTDDIEEELYKPFFARMLERGNLPVVAVLIVASASVASMLLAALFYGGAKLL